MIRVIKSPVAWLARSAAKTPLCIFMAVVQVLVKMSGAKEFGRDM